MPLQLGEGRCRRHPASAVPVVSGEAGLRLPAGVAAAADHAVEEGRSSGTGTAGPNAPWPGADRPRRGRRRRGATGDVLQAGGPGPGPSRAPPVRRRPRPRRPRPGQRHPARSGLPGPGGRVAPGLGEFVERLRQGLPPVGPDVRHHGTGVGVGRDARSLRPASRKATASPPRCPRSMHARTPEQEISRSSCSCVVSAARRATIRACGRGRRCRKSRSSVIQCSPALQPLSPSADPGSSVTRCLYVDDDPELIAPSGDRSMPDPRPPPQHHDHLP